MLTIKSVNHVNALLLMELIQPEAIQRLSI
ncbi:hypothetical protein SAMN05421821_101769 [Mucilaginibacter lappiensis]|uniref:Uncharacterized protein n=1 Tax=Mucilaginibacter lappiensis TaxID=354630 RepID=A0A1N6Q8C6_9SPHI|nr:hypothetical protein [Mucilaginibacter lappiensis]MBB6126418.1 hypothetical protein [Mucilaginibacter lappiensis]SIQ12838.1 hypothetical protein SAMN05421821_101769 [Mucilaginibacter lappiensis]